MNCLLAPFALGDRKGGVSALGEVTCMEMNLIAFTVYLSARAGGSENPQWFVPTDPHQCEHKRKL